MDRVVGTRIRNQNASSQARWASQLLGERNVDVNVFLLLFRKFKGCLSWKCCIVCWILDIGHNRWCCSVGSFCISFPFTSRIKDIENWCFYLHCLHCAEQVLSYCLPAKSCSVSCVFSVQASFGHVLMVHPSCLLVTSSSSLLPLVILSYLKTPYSKSCLPLPPAWSQAPAFINQSDSGDGIILYSTLV